MKALVVLAHPHPGSFNHAIARTVTDTVSEAGHEVVFHDLYAEGFDPLLQASETGAGDSPLRLRRRGDRIRISATEPAVLEPQSF